MDILETLLDEFEAQFSPAQSIQESDELFTTPEIINLFNSAVEIDKNQLFEKLQARGFIIKTLEKRFVWPVKEKPAL